MTFAFYGKAETSECTFKTFDLLFIPRNITTLSSHIVINYVA